MLSFILFIIFSYLIGSIPFGVLFAKLFKVGDLRSIGSGNIGATNAFRAGGKLLAILTLFFDVIKGMVPVVMSQFVEEFDAFELQAILGLCAVIGHIAPIWLRFRGGKGVATTVGVFLAIDLYFGAIMCGLWLLIFVITRIASLSSLLSILGTALLSTLMFYHYEPIMVAILWIYTIIIFYTHRTNISKLIKGQEKKITF